MQGCFWTVGHYCTGNFLADITVYGCFAGCFPAKRWVCGLGQHCASNFLVQCCLRCIWTTLTRLWNVGQHCAGNCFLLSTTFSLSTSFSCKNMTVRSRSCNVVADVASLFGHFFDIWISLCNVVPAWSPWHCIGYFAKKGFLLTIWANISQVKSCNQFDSYLIRVSFAR